jgi:hypothetical protein
VIGTVVYAFELSILAKLMLRATGGARSIDRAGDDASDRSRPRTAAAAAAQQQQQPAVRVCCQRNATCLRDLAAGGCGAVSGAKNTLCSLSWAMRSFSYFIGICHFEKRIWCLAPTKPL